MYPGGIRSLIEGFSKGFGTGANAMSVVSLIMLVGWVFGGISVTRHLIQSAILGSSTDLLGWAGLGRTLYFTDPMDALTNRKFWVHDSPSVPDPSPLFRYCFCVLAPAYFSGAKGALERERCQDSERKRLDS